MSNDKNRKLARMHLDLAHEIYCRREDLGVTTEELAEATGLTPDRIVMIEEGDTSSLSEVAQLCQGLRMKLTIEDGLLVRIAPIEIVRFLAGPSQEQVITKAGQTLPVKASADQQKYFTPPSTTTGRSLAHARH
jgi:transcriptional regulator with XRE-family HTH domain